MKNKVLILLLLFLPVAIIAVVLPANEYLAQGIIAVDCDGPIGVMIFAIVTYMIYGLGGIIYAKVYLKTKKTFDMLVVIFCISIMAVVTPNVLAALEQHHINSSSKECRKH